MSQIMTRIKRYYHYRKYKKMLDFQKYEGFGQDYRAVSRKIEYFQDRCLQIFLRIFYLFPIRKNRILFMSFEAEKYACNPRRITEYIAKNYPGEFEIIWAFTEEKNFRWLKDYTDADTVKYRSAKFYSYALTSRVFVYNMRIPAMIPFRKGQTVIGTGHGGGAYKKLLLDNPTISPVDIKLQKLSADHTDILISSCELYTKHVVRGAFAHKGECLQCGMPRNDELINHDPKDTKMADYIHKYYDIPKDHKLILYAPTYRKGKRGEASDYNLDTKNLVKAAKKRFGGEWSILYRMHYFITERLPKDLGDINIIDVTEYGDMQELLLASDILITDYSSSVWDYSLLGRPMFLYTTDLDRYLEKQGFYVDVRDWGFPIAKDNETLIRLIENFDEKDLENIKNHHKKFGSAEKGNAAETIAKRIHKACFDA